MTIWLAEGRIGPRGSGEYLAAFADRGMELTGLNCNGNPLNALPGVGPKHADDLRRTIRLAGLLGVRRVVTMSGTPGSDPDAKYPSWVVNPWDGVYPDVLDHQWGVAVDFWKVIDALARADDVKVAIEMHPHNVVFSPVTLKRLVDTEFLRALAEIDPDMAVNIEHEDAVYSQTDGLALAAENLHRAAAAL